MSNLIPFGKYRGQPIEAIAEDRQYIEWLAQQSWFRDKHAHLYSIVINNFCEPSDTPEHNELQAKFLDPEFRFRFAYAVSRRLRSYLIDEHHYYDELSRCVHASLSRITKPEIRYPDSDQLSCETSGLKFEETKGVDVSFAVSFGWGHYIDVSLRNIIWICSEMNRLRFAIEVKPEVGDDYPAIIRQMKRSGANFLFTRAYTGIGVDEKTFIAFFLNEEIRVVFERDVLSQEIPTPKTFDSEKFESLLSNLQKIGLDSL